MHPLKNFYTPLSGAPQNCFKSSHALANAGPGLCFVCLEDQTLAKKRPSFKTFFCYAISPLFINNSIHSGYIFVMIEHVL